MPTSRRKALVDFPPLTSWPQMTISPPWIVSSPFMQRSSVLLPEPLRPTMATICPWRTSSETPSSTFNGPKNFVTSRTCTTISDSAPPFWPKRTRAAGMMLSGGIHLPFESAARHRQRVADGKIDRRDEEKNQKRLKGRIVDDLSGARQLDEADDRGQRGVLHDLHHEADRRRRRDAD